MKITPEYIRKILAYDPETGNLVWLRRELRAGFERIDKGWNKRFAGCPVAFRRHRHGHGQIEIHCKNFMLHRVAWVHYYGEWPRGHLDHINGDPSDNRIRNLREATQSQNMMNAAIRSDNRSGVKGVSWSKKEMRWYAYINKNKKMISLGRYESLEDAIVARLNGEKIYHGDFARAA